MLRALRNIGIIAGLAIGSALLLYLFWEMLGELNPIKLEEIPSFTSEGD